MGCYVIKRPLARRVGFYAQMARPEVKLSLAWAHSNRSSTLFALCGRAIPVSIRGCHLVVLKLPLVALAAQKGFQLASEGVPE